jgi:hypothetical protein
MRGLIILAGESFRDGGRASRTTATQQSYDWQKEATDSHIRFFKHIEQKHGVTLDISLNSYQTKYSQDLLGWYKEDFNLIREYFGPKATGFNRNIKMAIRRIDVDNTDYDFIFVLRLDLLLKDALFDAFDPRWTNLMFPCAWVWFHEYYRNDKTKKLGKFECGYTYPLIVDTMVFFPKRLFQTSLQFTFDHWCWEALICRLGLTYDDMDMMIDTFHRPDSKMNWNPLYRMVSRPESDTWDFRGKKFNKYAY